MRRREFLQLTAAAAPLAALTTIRGDSTAAPTAELSRATASRPDQQRLVAMIGRAEIGQGQHAEVWTVSDGAIQPIASTIRTRTGDTVEIEFENALTEPTILHWHGLHVPEAADGHPRLAIDPGTTYRYRFPVSNRAGTYWYHAHPHRRTAEQVYRGMAGLFLVADADEDALGLPAGEREIPLILQDRRMTAEGEFAFGPVMHERMEGFLGDTTFGNGIRQPVMNVDSALHRLRVVNATGARIYRVALSTEAPMTLIGGDGGLLPTPVSVDHVDLGTGERVDLLVDFSGLSVGSRVMLRSLPFEAPGGMGRMRGMGGGMAGGAAQGAALDLAEFVVTREVQERPSAMKRFPAIRPLERAEADRGREFRFMSAMMRHTINGRAFEMDRTDIEVPFGSTEIWRFVNDSEFPHPVHVHEVQFQVLTRQGGRNQRFPWEAGWKDTVLVFPGEAVEVIARFDRHRGRYLMHCHNLVHEDLGMMANFSIV